MLAEYVDGTLTTEYVYRQGRLLATLPAGGSVQYHHNDHQSVRLTTDANGAVLGSQGHYPFGEAWYSTGTATPFAFTSSYRGLS